MKRNHRNLSPIMLTNNVAANEKYILLTNASLVQTAKEEKCFACVECGPYYLYAISLGNVAIDSTYKVSVSTTFIKFEMELKSPQTKTML